jgi:DNA-binding NarL/FixJ family response regulator
MKVKEIRLALADDHVMFRNGIANLLSEFKDINIVFEVSNGRELQKMLALKNDIDVILMDINMPLLDGYQATQWTREHYPQIHILALSMFDEDMAVIRMLKAGAGGYVLKESQPVELYNAIREIAEKGIFINEMVSGKMLKSIQSGETDPVAAYKLTDREIQFIKESVSELTYKEIADNMGISARSVDNYRENLFAKLEVKSRVGLVLFAIKNGIVDYKKV